MTNLDRIAARDARIINLQSELLDHAGHVRTGLPATRAQDLAGQINALRAANGLDPLDLAGRYRPRHARPVCGIVGPHTPHGTGPERCPGEPFPGERAA